MYGWGGLLTLGMRNMWFVQGTASFLNCPAILVLEFQYLNCFTMGRGPICFLPQGHCC